MLIPSDLKKWLKMRKPDCVHSSTILEYVEALEEDAGSKIAEIAMLENQIKQLKKIESTQQKWISVEEPPKKWRKNDDEQTLINYLVYSPDYGVDVGNWLEPAGVWVIMGLPVNITHWMPLPEPPKEV